jgi:hypothetical protein
MNEGILVTCLVFAVIGYLAAAALYFSGKKSKLEMLRLQSSLQAAESRSFQNHLNSAGLAKKKDSSQRNEKSEKKEKLHNEELVQLRKETGQLKNQLQQLKQENKDFGVKLKDMLHEKEVVIFQLQKDNEQLIASIREAEAKNRPTVTSAPNAQAQAAPAQIAAASQQKETPELIDLKKKLTHLERSLKSEKEFGEKLKQEKISLQSELRKWTSAAQDSDGKTLEPAMFKKWKDRALTARVQYQMMKQLREMSDIKLSTYQESVVRLAQFVFASTGSKAPLVQAGENTSDRFLAEALYALAKNQKSEKREKNDSSAVESSQAQDA